MSLLHICNTNFDFELEQANPLPFEQTLQQHEMFLQLQFLPFLYAHPDEGIAVSHHPDQGFLELLEKHFIISKHIHLLSDSHIPSYERIDYWGASHTLVQWARKHALSCLIPERSVVREINSKGFSFKCCPLPGSELLYNEHELHSFLESHKTMVVLKSCFGFSGRGHLFVDLHNPYELSKILTFAKKEWEKNLPLVGEPWVDRVLDFSSQWHVAHNGDIKFTGITLCQNDAKGKYQATLVGDRNVLFGEHLPMVEEHENFARILLRKIAHMGYFGNVGLDAMIYEDEKKKRFLQPLVEINARKTMGWIALMIQKRHYPHRILKMSYLKNAQKKEGFLPSFLLKENGNKIEFPYQLFFDIQ